MTTEFVTEDELADRTPEGLTVVHKWARVGGCPVWRGYDPDTQPVHEAGELAFVEQMDARRLESDRCQCGGLAAWDEDNPDVTVDHYPASFLTETHGS